MTPIQAQSPTDSKVSSFYFIRHAEKDTSNPADRDPDLVMEGVLRAARWSSISIVLILTSFTLRIISGRATLRFQSQKKRNSH